MKDFIEKLAEKKIFLKLVNNNLSIKYANGEMDKDLLEEIKDKKPLLINYLNSSKKNTHIPSVKKDNNYPLSSSQRRLWVLSQFKAGSIAYNVSNAYIFKGDLNVEALKYSFDELIDRHESLRTIFKEDEAGEVRQYIVATKEIGFQITCHDIRKEEKKEELVKHLIQEEFIKPFNFITGPLLRASIIQVEENRWIFTYVMHHIITDAWSMGVLIKELLLLYNSYGKGQGNPLTPLRIQYKDYAVWQQEQLKGETLQKHKEYWLKQFEGEIPILELPTDNIRPSIKTYNGGKIERIIGPNLSKGLKTICEEKRATVFMGLVSIVATLLYKYTHQEDIIIGSPIAGRNHVDLENQIGFYANTLPLRAQFKGENNFNELLENIKKLTLRANEHQAYPFDELLGELELERDMSRNPLFDVLIDFNNKGNDSSTKEQRLGNLEVRSFEALEKIGSKFDLTFYFMESDKGLSLFLEYNSDLYKKETVERMFSHLEGLLKAIIASPSTPINKLEYISEEEKNSLLVSFNNVLKNDAEYKTVISLFEEQVEKNPDTIAIVSGQTTLTYKTLNEKSNQLANYLIDNYHIQPDDLIGIMLDRSENMIISILGILKSGAAYVPIDPEHPKTRKEYIIQDTGIKVLISQSDYVFDLEYYNGDVFAIDIQLPAINTPIESPGVITHPDNLVYVIYTSGTTGVPKGCALTNSNLSNYVQWANNYYFRDTDKVSIGLFTSLSFDLTVTSIFCSLTQGGQLYIYNQYEELSKILYHSFSAESAINSIKLTPSHINLLEYLTIESSAMLRVIVGGEAVTPEHISILKKINPGIKIYNEYGPTETTVGCIVKQLEENAPILIGKPISKTSIYILDEEQALCPIGVPGEIYISGAGVAREYLKKPELTKEKILPNPFKQGERMYKTGDLGRWLLDGNIEFMGRKDDQVKIRGYRIELGEIESALQSHQEIHSAVVVVKANKDRENELVAYLVTKNTLNTSDVRAYLGAILPAYMIPNHFVSLDQIPLTTNGKIDRKKLPNPEGASMSTGIEYVAPCNEREQLLAEIWKEILEKDKVGIKDPFFEYGGDSIKVLRMMSEVRKKLNLDVSISEVYEHNTIENLLTYVEENKNEIEEKNKKAKENEIIVKEEIKALKERILASEQILNKENIEDIYPMSDIEKGMVFGSLLNKELGIYHDQFINQLSFVNFDIERFKLASALLVEKHSILRTSYNISDFETEVSIVHKKVEAPIQYEDISHLARQEQEKYVRNFLKIELQHPFQVTVAPMLRMNVFNFGGDIIVFVLQFHHAILDGWGRASFETELNNLYLKLGELPSYKPTKLKSDYKDFIIQNEIAKKDEVITDFWKEELADYTRLDLFTEEEDIRKYSLFFDNSYLTKLENTAVGMNTTVKVISFCAYLYLLKIINYDKYVVTGLVTNIRPNCEDSDKILGCFLNTIPFKTLIDINQKCSDFVSQIHNKLIELKSNERISLMEIARLLHENHVANNPFFDILFNYVDFHTYQAIESDIQIKKEEENNSPATNFSFGRERTNTFFDFTISVTGGHYSMHLNVNKKLKSGISLEKMGELYFKILNYIIYNPQKTIRQLDYLDEQEKHQLLVEFNDVKPYFSLEKNVIQLFEEQAKINPNKVAIKYNQQAMDYSTLNNKSNLLGNYLCKEFDVKADTLFGIMMDRSITMAESILGIWKSGGAYVPIDKEYPNDRIEQIINDSKLIALIIDNSVDIEKIKTLTLTVPIINLDAIRSVINNLPLEYLGTTSKPGDLAYVIYTSGSTGKPKGVMIEHLGMLNHLGSKIVEMKMDAESIVVQNAPHTFDISVWQLFSSLLVGGTTIIYDHNTIVDINQFTEKVNNDKVTVLELVPSYFVEMLMVLELKQKEITLPNLKILILNAETLMPSLVKRWFKLYPAIPIVNTYGATEASDDISHYIMHACPETSTIPVLEKPIQNFQVHIVDEDMRLVPIGVKGEILLSGPAVGRGYLNDEVRTKESFLKGPLNGITTNERIYKTGDLGKWLPNGIMEFIGRKDSQLKINGHRVELGEVETNLNHYSKIKNGVVIDLKDKQGKTFLGAFYTSDEEFDSKEIKEFLRTKLPNYMIPSHFIKLEELPLTPNGKIDKKALRQIEIIQERSQGEYSEPQTKIEKELVELWKEMFNLETVSIHDNFFELGGDSFKAIRIASRSNYFTVPDLYQHPSIAELAKVIEINVDKNKTNALLHLLLDTKDKAELSIIGFPNSAGEPFSFNETVVHLQLYSDNINFYGVKFPRKDLAEGESMETILENLSAEIVSEIQNNIKTPVLIFGQCNGNLLGIRVAEKLEKAKFDIKAICIGSIFPPKKINFGRDKRTNDSIIEFLNSLKASMPQDPSDKELFLKNFRYDSHVARAGFNYYNEVIRNGSYEKFKIPLYFITGDKDLITKGYKLKYKRWFDFAENVNLIVIKDVGHYLLRDKPAELAQLLQKIALENL